MTRLELLTEFVHKYKLSDDSGDDNVELVRVETPPNTQNASSSQSSTNYRKNLLKKFACPTSVVSHEQQERRQLREEINEYFASAKSCSWDTEVLKWWGINENNFPVVAKLARLILAIPATSAAAESAFSISSCVITAKRSRISPFKASQILFVHDNYDLINKYLLSS